MAKIINLTDHIEKLEQTYVARLDKEEDTNVIRVIPATKFEIANGVLLIVSYLKVLK